MKLVQMLLLISFLEVSRTGNVFDEISIVYVMEDQKGTTKGCVSFWNGNHQCNVRWNDQTNGKQTIKNGERRCLENDFNLKFDYKVGKEGNNNPKSHSVSIELGVRQGHNGGAGNVSIPNDPKEASFQLTDENMIIKLVPKSEQGGEKFWFHADYNEECTVEYSYDENQKIMKAFVYSMKSKKRLMIL